MGIKTIIKGGTGLTKKQLLANMPLIKKNDVLPAPPAPQSNVLDNKQTRDLVMFLDHNDGVLNIEVKNSASQFRNKPVIFEINGKNQTVNLDADGKAQIRFEKSRPSFMYRINIKDRGPLKKDQRLAFFY